MSTLRIAVRTWWSVALVAVAIAIAAFLPSTANANPGYTSYTGCSAYTNCGSYYGTNYGSYGYGSGYGMGYVARPDYRGYGYIQGGFGYRWTGYGWQRYQLAAGRYYVNPYSGKWRWVMTGYGWLIVDAAVTIG
jgi:hypothetical protein